jgi:outer membrane usher protein FimD/PapC
MQSFGHKCSFRHNLNCASDQKTYFTKVIPFGSLMEEWSSEIKNMHSFGHNQSFRHNLNGVSDQKNYFTRVVQFGSQSKEMLTEATKYAVIWSQMFISSQPKPCFQSKNFFFESC